VDIHHLFLSLPVFAPSRGICGGDRQARAAKNPRELQIAEFLAVDSGCCPQDRPSSAQDTPEILQFKKKLKGYLKKLTREKLGPT
jgi:hypothetical protein